MNKRNRNLIVLLSVMLLLVIGLCACMTKEKPTETDAIIPSTTAAAFEVDEWEDDPTTAGTTEGSGSLQPTQNQEDPSPTTLDTEPEDTTETTTPTQDAQPTEGTQATTPQSPYAPGTLSYDEYMALGAEEQQLYALAFSSVEEYIKWFNAVKAESNNDEVIEITGPVDLGDLS